MCEQLNMLQTLDQLKTDHEALIGRVADITVALCTEYASNPTAFVAEQTANVQDFLA